MKRALLENALYQPVALTLKSNPGKLLRGYLVKDRYNEKRFCILPLDIEKEVTVFCYSHVKDYVILSNNYLVK